MGLIFLLAAVVLLSPLVLTPVLAYLIAQVVRGPEPFPSLTAELTCDACGYSLADLPAQSRCPECGAVDDETAKATVLAEAEESRVFGLSLVGHVPLVSLLIAHAVQSSTIGPTLVLGGASVGIHAIIAVGSYSLLRKHCTQAFSRIVGGIFLVGVAIGELVVVAQLLMIQSELNALVLAAAFLVGAIFGAAALVLSVVETFVLRHTMAPEDFRKWRVKHSPQPPV